ncbi:MAG: nucleoside 2-deoxyribosyltransferase [Desulfobacterales bacterium]|nr:nucleoside 2-deoxyribosyltransferase [Desulfobacterales bacterium]
MTDRYQVYFGGDLFNHKDLIGNALLATHIEKVAQGRYQCYLPQSLEQAGATALDIRNNDLKKIVECDVGLFNFDGTELDAGTVVEFLYAKLLDLPCVIIRSDFRSSGEKDVGGDDWNLMCSFYPRTEVVQFSAIERFQDAMQQSDSLSDATHRLYTQVATKIIAKLDAVRKMPPLLNGDAARATELYRWALTFPGSGLETLAADDRFIQKILAAKIDKGLL